MEPEIVAVGEILGRVAQRYGLTTDAALAKALGVSRQTIGNWRSRGSLDHDLLIRTFPDADLNWLFRGSVAAPEGVEAALRTLAAAGYRVTLEPIPGHPTPPPSSS